MENLRFPIRMVVFYVTIAVLIPGCGKKKGGSEIMERTGIITFKDNPLTLVGNEVKVGDKAPEFEVFANDLSSYKLSSCSGKVRIISCVPSLDTPVCDIQTRRFNEETVGLGNDIVLLTISMDLPFAQARWCGAAGIDNAITLSDHRDADFGEKFGVLIKELRLLSRAIFIVDKDDVIRYIEIVPELTHEPDYDAAIKAARDLL
jgi:thiol peroxidase